jgi:Transglycosylase SLT domain
MKRGVLATLIAILLVPAAVCSRADERSATSNAVDLVRAKSKPARATAGAPSSVPSPLDRVAHAVDGAESSHGADLAMWRPDPAGPQGPMQVTEAAATDVGGGDRFDTAQNRAIGRAYLAQLHWRYKNWPDAIAAYNWGIGNLDAWVKAGRPADGFVTAVAVYLRRVLHNSGLCDGPTAAPLRKASLERSSSGRQQRSQADPGGEVQSDTFEQSVCGDLDSWGGAPDSTAFGFGPNSLHSKLEKAMERYQEREWGALPCHSSSQPVSSNVAGFCKDAADEISYLNQSMSRRPQRQQVEDAPPR